MVSGKVKYQQEAVTTTSSGATWCQWDGFIIRHCNSANKKQAKYIIAQGVTGRHQCAKVGIEVSMSALLPLLILSLALPALTRGQQVVQGATQPNLPVLFSFSQPSHNVAVFRGADLQRAIASGAVKGFGGLAAGAGGLGLGHGLGHGHGHGLGHGVAVHHSAPVVSTPAVVHSTPVAVAPRPVPVYHPVTPTRVVAPVAPVVHHRPIATVATAPLQAAYVDPYYNDLAEYSFEYGVADSISGSQFGDQESRFEDIYPDIVF